ncbi:hypothetical protein HYH02_009492 [Chlamydomonas schloesseri]|uniref:Uncharacterized protein n=1 Tax=Chlamydomonas schloesseri TaxID=2026947 RepID=A0A835TDF0_9CHLO|nr:hypothetical protein HYH02_009492 [Chlamydomonas schloesseri]|eukprot:KAG2443078.1 hypothetical protein HYH02_009492 [Chlamydomonas schloesseri]
MSTSRRSSTSSTASGARNGARASSNTDNLKKWVAEDTREEGKAAFKAHIKETSNLDVLSRCKKLNELLSSDVLKGKGDSKEQLKEILGILHAGPKRPSFLDKPPVTASTGKRAAAPPAQTQPAAPAPPGYLDEDALMRLLDSEDAGQAARVAQPSSSGTGQPQRTGPQPEDVDDLINLLNDASPPPGSGALPAAQQRQREREETERRRRIKEAQAEAERHRKAKEEEARQRKAEEEAERQRKAEEEEAMAEAQRLDRLRRGAVVCIQAAWRGHCARGLAAALRKEREVKRAAEVLQAAWRARRAAREHRACLAAATVLQAAVRAWRARRALQRLRVREFRQQNAARLIQRAYRHYRYTCGYTLGPLRVPPQGGAPRPGSGSGVDGAALLAKQLRLRSAVDARLAPEAPQPSQGDDSASQHRTVVTHRERVRQVSANERTRRADLGERAVMAGSSHRDEAEAMAIARTGVVSGPPPSAPGSQLPPTPRVSCGSDGGGRPLSRTGSGTGGGSRLGPEGSGRPPTAASSNESLGALRPSSSSLRRLSGSAPGRPASPGMPPSR